MLTNILIYIDPPQKSFAYTHNPVIHINMFKYYKCIYCLVIHTCSRMKMLTYFLKHKNMLTYMHMLTHSLTSINIHVHGLT